MARGVSILVAIAACLVLPVAADAHGDPVSDHLIGNSLFLPLNAKIDSDVVRRLATIVHDADEAGFRIKVAVVAEPSDLGSVFELYRKPQRFAEDIGKDLSAVYRDGLLIVMPNGFGYTAGGRPDPQLSRALAGLARPGRDPTKQAEAATVAVRRLAAAAGHRIASPKVGGGSETTDRITIAAAALAGLALLAGVALFRRERRARRD